MTEKIWMNEKRKHIFAAAKGIAEFIRGNGDEGLEERDVLDFVRKMIYFP
jgi:hypothetical protein